MAGLKQRCYSLSCAPVCGPKQEARKWVTAVFQAAIQDPKLILTLVASPDRDYEAMAANIAPEDNIGEDIQLFQSAFPGTMILGITNSTSVDGYRHEHATHTLRFIDVNNLASHYLRCRELGSEFGEQIGIKRRTKEERKAFNLLCKQMSLPMRRVYKTVGKEKKFVSVRQNEMLLYDLGLIDLAYLDFCGKIPAITKHAVDFVTQCMPEEFVCAVTASNVRSGDDRGFQDIAEKIRQRGKSCSLADVLYYKTDTNMAVGILQR